MWNCLDGEALVQEGHQRDKLRAECKVHRSR
jgi:hypothetical protein